MLYLKTLYILNTAVTALLGYHQKPNRAVNRANSNRTVFRERAVEISVHYTALYSPPYGVRQTAGEVLDTQISGKTAVHCYYSKVINYKE